MCIVNHWKEMIRVADDVMCKNSFPSMFRNQCKMYGGTNRTDEGSNTSKEIVDVDKK